MFGSKLESISSAELKEFINKVRTKVEQERNTVKPLTEELRDEISWGTYGIDGDQPLTYIKLRDMSHEHIVAVLQTQEHISLRLRNFFIQELFIRARMGQY